MARSTKRRSPAEDIEAEVGYLIPRYRELPGEVRAAILALVAELSKQEQAGDG